MMNICHFVTINSVLYQKNNHPPLNFFLTMRSHTLPDVKDSKFIFTVLNKDTNKMAVRVSLSGYSLAPSGHLALDIDDRSASTLWANSILPIFTACDNFHIRDQ